MKRICRNTKNHLLRYFLLFFGGAFVLAFLLFYFIETEVRETRLQELKIHERSLVELEERYLGREFSMVISDLNYLHDGFREELLAGEPLDAVAEEWQVFSKRRQIYDQIRYIDAKGDEKIRINTSADGLYIVPQNQLQNKQDRYYVSETMTMEEAGIYISPLDLNVEYDTVEVPYKPVIRFATPVYDSQGDVEGVIVLNLLADYVLKGFRELAKNSFGEIILLNAKGYKLSSDNPEDDFNFMFDTQKARAFKTDYPYEWSRIEGPANQFLSELGAVTSVPVVLDDKFTVDGKEMIDQRLFIGDERWHIVSIVERNHANRTYFMDDKGQMALDVLRDNALSFFLIALVSLAGSFTICSRQQAQAKIKYFSEYDGMTDVLNRRAGMKRLERLYPAGERRSYLVSLCYIDINGLKQVNDALGHKHGDDLIKTVTSVIKEKIRREDFVVRLGGDEFLIAFDGIGAETAARIWRRIVDRYEAINAEEGRPYQISVSHGIVAFDNERDKSLDELMNMADDKMYSEKQKIKGDGSFVPESPKN